MIWNVGRSKFGFLGEKWLKLVTFSAELMTVRLSEPRANAKRNVTSGYCQNLA